METTIAIVFAVIALILTPVYVWLMVKGVRSLSDIRDVLKRPPDTTERS